MSDGLTIEGIKAQLAVMQGGDDYPLEEVAFLLGEVERLSDALLWYARREHYRYGTVQEIEVGRRAREALGLP